MWLIESNPAWSTLGVLGTTRPTWESVRWISPYCGSGFIPDLNATADQTVGRKARPTIRVSELETLHVGHAAVVLEGELVWRDSCEAEIKFAVDDVADAEDAIIHQSLRVIG